MKNEIELLKEEIQLLKEKYSLLELRFRIVHEKNLLLEQQLNPVRIVSQWESCQHDYPNPWGATVPPTCKKCGKQASSYTITSTNGVANFTMMPDGRVMPNE